MSIYAEISLLEKFLKINTLKLQTFQSFLLHHQGTIITDFLKEKR